MKLPKIQHTRFLFANEFLQMLILYRALWIKGRYGGGKTILSVLLGAWLMANHKIEKFYSNFPSAISSPMAWNNRENDACFDLDEAHAFIEDRNDVKTYAKYLRKTNYYLLMPSVMPPHNRLTFFSCQRIFNGYTVGIPLWFYRWDIRSMRDKVDGWFMVWAPHLAFGSYDTLYIPFDDADIGDHIQYNIWSIAEEEAKQQGRKNKIPKPDRISNDETGNEENQAENKPDDDGMQQEMDDVVYQMQDVSYEIEDAVTKFKKRSRKR